MLEMNRYAECADYINGINHCFHIYQYLCRYNPVWFVDSECSLLFVYEMSHKGFHRLRLYVSHNMSET